MNHRIRRTSGAIGRPAALIAMLAILIAGIGAALAQASSSTRRHGGHGHDARQAGSAHGIPPLAISPLAGTLTASPQTQISFLGVPAKDLSAISVVGSKSGRHQGRLRSYDSAPGASFVPEHPFRPGEKVTVHVTVRNGNAKRTMTRVFGVAEVAHPTYKPFPGIPGKPADVQSFHSTQIKPPVVTVNKPAGMASAPGYLFAAPFMGPGEHGPMIFQSNGSLVWFDKLPAGWAATDLKLKRYEGHEDLVWWQGMINNFGFGRGEDVIANDHYEVVGRIHGGNGVMADLHEVQITPGGSALITAYDPVYMNTSSVKGGAKRAVVLDAIMQEVDIKTGLVMWEWNSVGHVPLSESHSPAPKKASQPYDYFHINSIDVLRNGNYLISSRNTWGVFELNRITGTIGWQLGGKKSTFKLGKNVQFAWQHHVRMLPNGEITVFDDEGAPEIKPPTRGEIIRLSFKKRTATLVQQLVREPEPLKTGSQGDVQPLPNGNWMLGWGGLPNFTEFNHAGKVVYDAQFPKGEMSYRVYRFKWEGMPSTKPAVSASTVAGKSTVYASWNGATGVKQWRLLAGASATGLAPVSTVADTGFETAIQTAAAPYVQVQAIGAEGKVIGESPAITPTG